MKKVLVPIIIFILIFNFIFLNTTTYCADDGSYNKEVFEQANQEGTTKGPNDEKVNTNQGASKSVTGAIVGILAAVVDIIPMLFNKFLIFVTHEAGYINWNKNTPNINMKKDFKWFTVEKVVFGNYYIFNTDVFSDSVDLKVTNKQGVALSTDDGLVKALNDLREQVAIWYNIMRVLSLIIGFLTLIYMGIRMAISTVADEQARYKKMLVSWVQSIVLIVVLPYIMVTINYIGTVLLNLIDSFRTSLKANGQISFETEILDTIYGTLGEKRWNDSGSLFNSILDINIYTI